MECSKCFEPQCEVQDQVICFVTTCSCPSMDDVLVAAVFAAAVVAAAVAVVPSKSAEKYSLYKCQVLLNCF